MANSLARRSGLAELRIGTAEREQAATLLGQHFSAGRLDTAEFDDRVRHAYQARTTAELAVLFTDLPGNHPGAASQAPGRHPRGERWAGPSVGRRLMVFLLLVIAGGIALIHLLPLFFLFPLLWFAFSRFRRRRYRPAGHFYHRQPHHR